MSNARSHICGIFLTFKLTLVEWESGTSDSEAAFARDPHGRRGSRFAPAFCPWGLPYTGSSTQRLRGQHDGGGSYCAATVPARREERRCGDCTASHSRVAEACVGCRARGLSIARGG